MAIANHIVDRREQRLNSLQSISDRSRRKAQSQQPKLLDGAVHWPLQMKLFQEQVPPQARAIDALGQHLRRQRRGDGSLSMSTITSRAVTFAATHSTIDDGFNFDLFDGVAVPKICQRLATASTDFGVFG